MKYRKKPLVVEAWQFKKDNWADRPHWIDVAILNDECEYLEVYPRNRLFIYPHDEVENGSWIIRGIEGEIYQCTDSVFQKTYERVEE